MRPIILIFCIIVILISSDTDNNIHELYNETKSKFKNTDEFIISLDVLYALDMINVDFETENIEYVKRN